ncbi:hypothetical protein LCM4573_23495 [Rhizobium sp. LCM 4573]|nr:hypothetical protein LCM4573_23495 [Rhizobium sp. LCM 4573]
MSVAELNKTSHARLNHRPVIGDTGVERYPLHIFVPVWIGMITACLVFWVFVLKLIANAF